MGRTKVVVVGESCIDSFSYGAVKRLAPDLPIPVLSDCETMDSPGMAANVARNLKNLGANVDLVTNPNWHEVRKTRFVHAQTNHTFLRVDLNDKISPIEELPDLSSYDMVFVSDYDKGFLTRDQISSLCSNHPRVFLDTKKVLGPFAEAAHTIKINEKEFYRSKDFLSETLRSKIVQTKGGAGAEFQGEKFSLEQEFEVLDTSGAGDAFFAALGFEFLISGSMTKSIVFANKMASEVVRHRGVTAIAESYFSNR